MIPLGWGKFFSLDKDIHIYDIYFGFDDFDFFSF